MCEKTSIAPLAYKKLKNDLIIESAKNGAVRRAATIENFQNTNIKPNDLHIVIDFLVKNSIISEQKD